MMSQQAIKERASDLFAQWRKERAILDRIDLWYRWRQEPIRLPRNATPEMKMLEQLSRTPWLNLIVTATAQLLYVDAWKSLVWDRSQRSIAVDDRVSPPAWRRWQANDLDRKQIAIHRSALAYGYSYVTVLPGEDADGGRAVTMKGVSPREMFAVYRDPANDEWPEFAIHVERSGGDYAIKLYDEEHRYFLSRSRDSDKLEFIESRAHEAGVVPVARFANQLDLEGRAPGEVEPYIPIARRINKTDHDLLLAQHYSSSIIRTVAGLSQPGDDEEANRKKAVELGYGKLLVAEDPDTKFGYLPAGPLNELKGVRESNVKALSAVSQTPTHELTGDLINLSAEALAAAKAAQRAKVGERKRSFGGTWNSALRLGDYLEGYEEGATDYAAHVSWQDDETSSLSQAADALGKFAQMLGVPVEALWGRIPGVTATDVEEWKQLKASNPDPMVALADSLSRQSAPTG